MGGNLFFVLEIVQILAATSQPVFEIGHLVAQLFNLLVFGININLNQRIRKIMGFGIGFKQVEAE